MDQNKLDKLNEAAQQFQDVQNEISQEEKELLDRHVSSDTIQKLVDTINAEFEAQKDEKRKARNQRKAAKNKLLKKATSKIERRKASLVTKII